MSYHKLIDKIESFIGGKFMNHKKKRLAILVSLLCIVAFIFLASQFQKHITKRNFERDTVAFANKNKKTVFEVNQIVLFSTCDAKNKTGFFTNFTIENLYQYADLAIFINHSSRDEKTLENTFKKVSISNIQYTSLPKVRTTTVIF